jgi:outer membrane protein OmpA-like peptidoglycan-associated protein
LTLTSTSGTYGSALTLTSSGGSGTGAVSYAVTSAGTAGCSISAGALSATSAGTCTVTVTKAGDAGYYSTSSPATTVTFAMAPQAPLTLASTHGIVGTKLTLTSSGGSGTGVLSYAVTNAGTASCSISGGTGLNAVTAGTCTVTVTKAGDANFGSTSSAATTVTIIAKIAPKPPTATITIGGFANNSSALTPTLKQQITALAKLSASKNYRVARLSGYASSTGAPSLNLLLSHRRADQVAAYLRTQLAVLHVTGVSITANGLGIGTNPAEAANRIVVATCRA